MEHKGYKLTRDENGIIVEGIRDFDPVHTLECGQSFRWLKQPDCSYLGVARGKVVGLVYTDGMLKLKNVTTEDFINIWYDYFDLGRDYGAIKDKLAAKDEAMRAAVEFGHGIRLLRQDIWEMLISFIISANNMIPRIMKTVAAIAKVYGEEVLYQGSSYYTFPDAVRLAESSVEELDFCKGGFRCKYIISSSRMVSNGEVALDNIVNMNTDRARNELMKFPGVGPKVADCVLLYSGTKYDVFPTDVWVKRVMEELYFKREAGFKEIQDFAADYFGEHAGIAQQYLFYYARENKIGTK